MDQIFPPHKIVYHEIGAPSLLYVMILRNRDPNLTLQRHSLSIQFSASCSFAFHQFSKANPGFRYTQIVRPAKGCFGNEIPPLSTCRRTSLGFPELDQKNRLVVL